MLTKKAAKVMVISPANGICARNQRSQNQRSSAHDVDGQPHCLILIKKRGGKMPVSHKSGSRASCLYTGQALITLIIVDSRKLMQTYEMELGINR